MAEPVTRNPHAGLPFTDDDATIARALEDVSVPALLCSLVHLTGDPSWIRGDLRPTLSMLNEYQGGLSEEQLAEARARALPRSRPTATVAACCRRRRRRSSSRR